MIAFSLRPPDAVEFSAQKECGFSFALVCWNRFVGFDERRFFKLLIPVFGVTAVFRGVVFALSDLGWLPQQLCLGPLPVSWQ